LNRVYWRAGNGKKGGRSFFQRFGGGPGAGTGIILRSPAALGRTRTTFRHLPSTFQGLLDHPSQTGRQPLQNRFLVLILVKKDTLTTDPVPGAVLLGAGAIGIDPFPDRTFDGYIWVHHSPCFDIRICSILSGDAGGGQISLPPYKSPSRRCWWRDRPCAPGVWPRS